MSQCVAFHILEVPSKRKYCKTEILVLYGLYRFPKIRRVPIMRTTVFLVHIGVSVKLPYVCDPADRTVWGSFERQLPRNLTADA